MDAVRSLPRPQSSFSRAFPLAVWLAARGAAVRTSLAIVALGALGAVAAAIAGRERPWIAEVPAIASTAIAWGAGVMVAFAAALRALHNDREEGVLALARARGVSPMGYVGARVGGVVAVLALAVGGAVLVAGIAVTAVARPSLPAARSSLAALIYALAFAATLGPVAMAALGARTRAGGYFTLLLVLALPELLAPWTAELLPPGWHELTSIPAALEALRRAIAGPTSALHAVRALAGIAAVIGGSLLVVRARVPRR
jgi:hypothetical protein